MVNGALTLNPMIFRADREARGEHGSDNYLIYLIYYREPIGPDSNSARQPAAHGHAAKEPARLSDRSVTSSRCLFGGRPVSRL